ncbi:hypothetical protein TgHK011_005148 [Trichoderma gracile]|nr:hypothetical protein TgHK011_005148 [Trichoderma gracile]
MLGRSHARPMAKEPYGVSQPTEQTQPFIEADPNPGQDDEADSALGEDAASSTASLTESILQYRTLHGRTYQSFKNANYWGFQTTSSRTKASTSFTTP